MATNTWESVLLAFAPSDRTTFLQRSAVTGDEKVQWIANHRYETLPYFKQTGGDEGYDVWWSYNYTDGLGKPWSHVIGCNLNWKQFQDEGTELGKWIRQGYDALMPLAHSPYENDSMSPWSFDTAVSTLKGAEQLLQTWVPTIKGWTADVAAPGADWQGTAAGVFRTMLDLFGHKVENLAKALQDKHVDTLLRTARDAMGQAVLTMWNGQEAYRDSRDAWPVNPLFAALVEGMSTAKVTVSEGLSGTNNDGTAVAGGTVDFRVTTAWGDPHGDDFWKQAEKRAKEVWLKNVADILDKAAGTAAKTLDNAYGPAIQSLAEGIHVRAPKPPYRAAPDDPLGGGSDPFSDVSKNLSDLNKNMNDSLTTMNKGMNDNLKGMSDSFRSLTGGGPDSGLPTGGPGGLGGGSGLPGLGGGSGLPGLGGGSGLPGLGGGSGFPGVGSGVPVLDENGKQVFDGQGNPVTVPPGSHIDPTTHQVIGPDGKPVLGADGKPITVPRGATVGTGPGEHMKVPPGSHVDDQGRVIGPDGRPVLDRNGNPVLVEPGSRVDGDGTLLDPDGRPVSELSQLLADQRHAFESGFGGGDGDGLIGGGGPGSGYTRLPGGSPFGGSGDTDGLGLGGYSGTGLMPGGRSGMSAKALAGGGDPNTVQARAAAEAAEAAEKAAAARAAAEAERNALTGKGTATTGGMPPMMPPGAGAGAPNQKDKDRQRTTWLAEDEEVWGTESTAVSGVIGR
ncbi:hypothetical protein [Kitasatospora sp. NPDC005856]|uniref:hypothetical protein n=1 Tax=Kitasatospora sp. NPDC005856 TaxID=3154566 RepID=UPI0033C11FEB